jgi:hypothetical protein
MTPTGDTNGVGRLRLGTVEVWSQMATPLIPVTVTSGAQGRLRRAGEAGCFLLVKPAGLRAPYDEVVVSRVRQGVDDANAAVDTGTTMGVFTAATGKGVAVAALRDTSSPDTSSQWLTALAGALETRGLPGTISDTGTWGPGLDPIARANFGRRFPTAFVAYQVDSYPARAKPLRGWQVDSSTTRTVSEQLQFWAESRPLEESWVGLTFGNVRIQTSDIATFFESTSAICSSFKILDAVNHDRGTCRRSSLAQFGQLVSQVVDPDADWRSLLDAQIEVITTNPHSIDVALIKNVGGIALAWSDVNIRDKHAHPTTRDPIDYDANRHLWDEYVIDAAGVQLLTSKHLEHAVDLSDWRVENVSTDRYLVSAKSLDRWYADTVPDPDTISKARQDFGDMILTWDAILAKPGPYTVTDPAIVGR